MKVVESRTAGWPQLVLLLVAGSMPVLGAVLIAPVLPLIAQQYADVPGVEVLVPIVLTVPALVIGLTAPFAGQIVDRLGRLRVLRVALVGYAIAGTAPLYLDGLSTSTGWGRSSPAGCWSGCARPASRRPRSR